MTVKIVCNGIVREVDRDN